MTGKIQKSDLFNIKTPYWICKRCGRKNRIEYKYCPYCGKAKKIEI